MTNKYQHISDNLYILDSYDMEIDSPKGDNCFIIGHHVDLRSTINNTSSKLVNAGFRYFNVFGEQAHLWEETMSLNTRPGESIEIEASTVARIEMCYTLAMLATMKPHEINFVLSDDYYFTEYLVEDLNNIVSGHSQFSPHDWQRFRFGFEFNVHGKDAIISVYKGVMAGFLGEEMAFDTINEAFKYKLFDGQSFNEIWRNISR